MTDDELPWPVIEHLGISLDGKIDQRMHLINEIPILKYTDVLINIDEARELLALKEKLHEALDNFKMERIAKEAAEARVNLLTVKLEIAVEALGIYADWSHDAFREDKTPWTIAQEALDKMGER